VVILEPVSAHGNILTHSQFIDRDTVASVGRNLPFASSNTIIKTFRQALSLDERRVKFRPNPWHKASSTLRGAAHDAEHGTAVPRGHLGRVLHDASIKMNRLGPRGKVKTKDSEDDTYFGGKETDVKQVWFAGSHSGEDE
jgi:uncharacterized protein (DUF2235 family)